ncbi:hypothetical protein FP828_09080 [bacterium]|nr:hypothetical protein [bacterium]
MKKSLSLLLPAVVSGILLNLCFPPISSGYLVWVALLPLFYAVNESENVHQASNISALTGLVFYLFALKWFFRLFGPVGLGLICVLALFLVLSMVMTKSVLKKYGIFWGWLAAAPVFWTGIEYFRSEMFFLEFTWLGLGFSQVSNPILQTASLWGTYGISFMIVLSSGLVVTGIKKGAKYILAGVFLPASFWAWGYNRTLNLSCDNGEVKKVSVIQDESFNLQKLLEKEDEAIEQGADIIVWPEYSITMRPKMRELELMRLDEKNKNKLRVIGAMIEHGDRATKKSSLFSGRRKDKKTIENFALIINGRCDILGRYDKHHPIPIIESHVKASPDVKPVDTPVGKLGIQICYDLDFEDGSRKLVNRGAQIILVPNLDPDAYGKIQHLQHSAMSPMRAVEANLWIARAASSGISQIIDPAGRIIKSMEFNKSGILTGDVRLRKGGTFYTKYGWLLSRICLLITFGFPAVLILKN